MVSITSPAATPVRLQTARFRSGNPVPPCCITPCVNFGTVMGIQPFEGSTMKKSGLPLVLFGLLLGFSLPVTSAQAQATRTWVSGVGDDANPCSRTAPCKTFAGAISKTAAGGEIDCLDPGGFGGVTITKSMSIDCGTFPGGILNAGSVNGVVVNTAAASDKVVLRNLVINGTVSPSPGPGLNGIRWINLGQELHLDRVVITGDTDRKSTRLN